MKRTLLYGKHEYHSQLKCKQVLFEATSNRSATADSCRARANSCFLTLKSVGDTIIAPVGECVKIHLGSLATGKASHTGLYMHAPAKLKDEESTESVPQQCQQNTR
jgi:hypothetical protein